MGRPALIELRDVGTRYEQKVVHDGVSFAVMPGEVFAIVGASGSGKSVLLREMTTLERPTTGSICVFGEETVGLQPERAMAIRRRIGILFQDGALFSGLDVLDNVGLPLREHHPQLGDRLIDEIAVVKLGLVGLASEVGRLFPRQLSGGMRKRAALARAMALDPELLFLDEPSSGLDPITADGFDELILRLRQALTLTVVMVSHDMDSLWRVADRVVLLGGARALAVGSMPELAASSDPAVRPFFSGPRGRAAREAAWNRR